jgi:hypothetical protein
LDPHLSTEQLLAVHFGNGLVDIGSIFKCNECVTLTTAKPRRQADFGTGKHGQQGALCSGMGE